VIGLVMLVVVGLMGAAHATPAQELEDARELFRARDFDKAIPQLNYLLYPTPRLSQTDDLVEAHVLLGVCSFESGDRKTARREFEEALYLNADVTLDTLLFSAAAVEYFEDVKKALAESAARDAEQRLLAEQNERLQKILESMVVIETRPYYVNYIPFGAGQFQNGDRRKGLFFAAAESVTGGLSAGLFLYIYGQYGFGAKISRDEANTVLTLQRAEIGAGSACIALMLWGLFDSLVHYQPSVRKTPDESLIPPDLRKSPSLTPRPAITPNQGGASLSLTWEL
jgi:hypothetical protein